MPVATSQVPFDSDALRANIASTAQEVVIPERYLPLVEAVEGLHGVRAALARDAYRSTSTPSAAPTSWSRASRRRCCATGRTSSGPTSAGRAASRCWPASCSTCSTGRSPMPSTRCCCAACCSGARTRSTGSTATPTTRASARWASASTALLERAPPRSSSVTRCCAPWSSAPSAGRRWRPSSTRIYRPVLLGRLRAPGRAPRRAGVGGRRRAPGSPTRPPCGSGSPSWASGRWRPSPARPATPRARASSAPTSRSCPTSWAAPSTSCPASTNLEDRFAVCLFLLKDETLGYRQDEVMVVPAARRQADDAARPPPRRRDGAHAVSRRSSRGATTSSCSRASSATRPSAWPIGEAGDVKARRPPHRGHPLLEVPVPRHPRRDRRVGDGGQPLPPAEDPLLDAHHRVEPGALRAAGGRPQRAAAAGRRLHGRHRPLPARRHALPERRHPAHLLRRQAAAARLPRVLQRRRRRGRAARRLDRDRRDLRAARHADALPPQAGSRRVVQPPGRVQPRRAASTG